MSRALVVHAGWSRFPIHAPPIKVPSWRKNSFLPDTLSGRCAGRNHPPRDRVECGEIPTATNSRPLAMRKTAAMETFVFKTTIDAVVRVQAADEDSARRAVPGLPPEKWSSLMYGLWPDGGLKNGKEATHCGRDRHEAAAG